MTRYFIAANIWLVLAVVAIFGCTNVSYDPQLPPMSSFFRIGQQFHSSTYTLIVLAMIAMSVTFFILAWKTRNKS
jgi:hypothetical protein